MYNETNNAFRMCFYYTNINRRYFENNFEQVKGVKRRQK